MRMVFEGLGAKMHVLFVFRFSVSFNGEHQHSCRERSMFWQRVKMENRILALRF